MKKFYVLLTLLMIYSCNLDYSLQPQQAHATTSTINPTVPANGAPLAAKTFRDQFLAAYNDINALWSTVQNFTINLGSTNATGVLPPTKGGTGLSALCSAGTVLGSDGVNFICQVVSGTGTVTTTGSPATGNMTKFSGSTAITNAVAGTDYQAPITLTTTGSSGAATLIANTLNIPQYGGGGGTPGGTAGQIQFNSAGSFGGFTTSGDATVNTATGVLTLATVNSNVGSFGAASTVPNFTVNGKGLVTAAGSTAVVAPAGTLSGATLNSGVTASSLTSVGTLTGGATGAGFTLNFGTSTQSGVVGSTHGGAGAVTGILKADGSGTISAATSGTDYAPATSGSSILKGSAGGFANAVSGTDYAPATTGTSILKASSGGFANAVSGTDYAPATSGASILYGNGSGGFSPVTIGSGLSFSTGTLSSTAGGGSVTSVDVSGGTTGLTTSGGPVTGSGTITFAGDLVVANGGTGLTAVPGSAGQLIFNSAGTYGATGGLVFTSAGRLVAATAQVASDIPLTAKGAGSQTAHLQDWRNSSDTVLASIDKDGNFAATNFSGSSSGNNTGDQTSVTGNAGTATALATARAIGGVNFDGTAAITPQQLALASEASDTTNFPMFLNTASTAAQQPKYNSSFIYNASANSLTATTFIGALTGNASTATALAANGTNCSAGQFPLGVDASGNSETCTALPTTIVGTANQVTASAATGTVTLSLPQDIATSSSPQFTGVNVGNATDTTITRASAGVIAVEGTNVILNGGALGTPASGVATNLTGTASGLTAGTVTTNANLTGGCTSVGNAVTCPSKIGITIDGGGSVPATGAKPGIVITVAQTITNWYIAADQSCSAVIDLKRSGTSIIGGGGNKPTLSSAAAANAAASGWTSTALAVGDTITFNLDSAATCLWINLVVKTTTP